MRLLINKDIEIVSHNSNEFQSDFISYVWIDLNKLLNQYNIWFDHKQLPDAYQVKIIPQKVTLESVDINCVLSAIEDINFLLLKSDQFTIKLQYIYAGQGCDLSLEMSVQKDYP